jgi:hypothetical protein
MSQCLSTVHDGASPYTLVQVLFEPHLHNITVQSNTLQVQNLPMLLAALNVPTLLYVLTSSLLVWFPILL